MQQRNVIVIKAIALHKAMEEEQKTINETN